MGRDTATNGVRAQKARVGNWTNQNKRGAGRETRLEGIAATHDGLEHEGHDCATEQTHHKGEHLHRTSLSVSTIAQTLHFAITMIVLATSASAGSTMLHAQPKSVQREN